MTELIFDFLLLFLVTNYVYFYQSPVLNSSVKKVFFCFPSGFDNNEKWKRVKNGELIAEQDG